MDEVRKIALDTKPKVIVAGWSAYPRTLDFAAFGRSPTRWAPTCGPTWRTSPGWSPPVCILTRPAFGRGVLDRAHKTLGGPRSVSSWPNRNGPEAQLGRLPRSAGRPAHAYDRGQGRCPQDRRHRGVRRASAPHSLSGAKILADRLTGEDVAKAGVSVLTGGTDVHLVLVDLRNSALDGQQAEDLLHEVGITVNRNAVPFDPRPPMVTSGLRIGTPPWPPAASATSSSPRLPTSSAPRSQRVPTPT